MNKLLELLRGRSVAPVLVGFVRGTLEGIAFLVIAELALLITSVNLEAWGIPSDVIPFALFGWSSVRRTAEGWADQIDPAKKRLPPERSQPVEGG